MKIAPPAMAFLVMVASAHARGTEGPSSARVILRLEKPRQGEASLTIENAAPVRSSVHGTTFAVLTAGEGEREHSYWARVPLSTVPQADTPLALPPQGKVTSIIRLADLRWSEDRSGLTPELPLARLVPPGSYRVQLQVEDPELGWWRSNELQAVIGPAGSVTYR